MGNGRKVEEIFHGTWIGYSTRKEVQSFHEHLCRRSGGKRSGGGGDRGEGARASTPSLNRAAVPLPLGSPQRYQTARPPRPVPRPDGCGASDPRRVSGPRQASAPGAPADSQPRGGRRSHDPNRSASESGPPTPPPPRLALRHLAMMSGRSWNGVMRRKPSASHCVQYIPAAADDEDRFPRRRCQSTFSAMSLLAYARLI